MDEERIARLFGLTFVTRVLLQALVVIPMTTKDFSVFMSQMRPNSLAPEHTS